jgi:anthranilate phosphoribosyltransferase
MTMASNRALKVATAEESKAMLLGVLDNQPGAAKETVVFNSGVALYAANVANSVAVGIQLARSAIESGAARSKLDALVARSQSLQKGTP